MLDSFHSALHKLHPVFCAIIWLFSRILCLLSLDSLVLLELSTCFPLKLHVSILLSLPLAHSPAPLLPNTHNTHNTILVSFPPTSCCHYLLHRTSPPPSVLLFFPPCRTLPSSFLMSLQHLSSSSIPPPPQVSSHLFLLHHPPPLSLSPRSHRPLLLRHAGGSGHSPSRPL